MTEEEKKEKFPFPTQYAGQRQPPMSEKDVQKQAYRLKRETDKKRYLIAQEALFKLYEHERAVKEGRAQEITKSALDNQIDIAVRKILRGGK